MYVKGLMVTNFRSLKQVSLTLHPGLNVLVGKNNAGKSNMIRAIDYVLGEKWPTYRNVEHKDFYTESDKDGSFVSDRFQISIGLGGSKVNEQILQRNNRSIALFRLQQGPLWKDANYFPGLDLIDKSWVSHQEIGIKLCSAKKVVLLLNIPREGKKGERLYWLIFQDEIGWWCVQNITSDLRDSLLTTAYIPSFRDPNNQLRINSFTWYGKLIEHLYNKKTDEQGKLIHDAQEAQLTVLKDIFDDATKNLQDYLKQAVFHNQVTFAPNAVTKDDEYKSITLFVDDGLNSPFYEKGSGIQSALIIGLFSLYCNTFHKGSSLLLAEEPELYLHPQARRAIEARLVEFTNQTSLPDSPFRQVIISTHSPEFLRSVPLKQVIVVRRPKSQIDSAVETTQSDLAKTQQMLQTKNAELMFADFVVLVEGGEEYIFPPLADLFKQQRGWLDIHNVSVVRVNGKGSFFNYTKILDDLKIPWAILTDLDFVLDGIEKFQNKISSENWQKAELVRTKLKEVVKDPQGKQVKKELSRDKRDWQSIYKEIDAVVKAISNNEPISPTRREAISDLWGKLSDRILQPDYKSFFDDESNKRGLHEIVSTFNEKGIFIISIGDLESCLSEEAMLLGYSKDIRALEVGGKLLECKSWDEVSRWINPEIFLPVFKYVEKQVQN